MNIKKMTICCTALLLSANVAWAEDGDEAESTIRLMDAAEVELPEAVIKKISLPAAATEDTAAVENAVRGHNKANDNRQQRKKSLSQADAARERRSDRADETHDNRENRGRSENRPEEPPANPNPRPPGS